MFFNLFESLIIIGMFFWGGLNDKFRKKCKIIIRFQEVKINLCFYRGIDYL